MMQKSTYEQLKLLVERGAMTVAEWEALAGKGFPNRAPFYPVVEWSGGRIILDKETAQSIPSNAMYSWHYEVLRAVLDALAKTAR